MIMIMMAMLIIMMMRFCTPIMMRLLKPSFFFVLSRLPGCTKSLNRQRCSANTKQELLVIFDAEQVYLKVELINLKNMEVTANPKPHTLEKIGLSNTLKPKA